jgi:predicted nucleic acid-binding Zn ribbon protein
MQTWKEARMPTYVYEEISSDSTQAARYEFDQRMSAEPLTKHPDTGVPIRRVPAGGAGITGFAEVPGCAAGDCGLPGSDMGGCASGACPF